MKVGARLKYHSSTVKIIGMSAVVPDRVIDNMESCDDKKIKKFIKMTGIIKRHAIDFNKYNLVDLAVSAAEHTISKSGIDISRIKYLVYITQKAEFAGPSTAFYVQKQLNLGIDCMVFDVNLGCSGFVAGLQIVSSLLNGMEDGSLALMINAENMTSIIRENKNDEMLFGDAATAVLLEKNTNFNEKFFGYYFSDGNRYDAIFQKDFSVPCHMDGQAVFEFSIYEVAEYLTSFLTENHLKDEDIDHVVFHQAQKFIIDHLASNAKLDVKKLLYSLDEYGNTSGTSIPLAICKNIDLLKEKGRYLLSGFGVGLAWGISYIEIDKKNIFGVIKYDV